MCGIYGFLQKHPLEGGTLAAISRVLRHRGPDDEGMIVAHDGRLEILGGSDTPEDALRSRISYTPEKRLPPDWVCPGGGVVLGHRRLSILDLSPAGHQPMSYRGRFWITFNGEVYNYIEVREELRRRGHDFTTGADTEVILAAYAEWGPHCLERFNGMWAFAILDLERATVFLARDRFGVKPLYYHASDGDFAFASEIKAFTRIPGWRAQANRQRLLDFLVWNISDHTSETFFKGVHQVPPGHYVVIDARPYLHSGGAQVQPQVQPQKWYAIPQRDLPERAAAEELRAVLESSIRLRLRSDVPVGSCLSGGLDSSAIVCLAARQLRQSGTETFNTFTAGSAVAAYDETRYAKAVIESVGARAHFVVPEAAGFLDEVDRLVWHQDEPFPTSSIYAQWCVFRTAREKGAVVMLDGQGADEILGGYRGYFGAFLAGLATRGQLGKWISEARTMRREIGFSYMRSAGYTLAYAAPAALGVLGRFEKRAYSDKSWINAKHHAAFVSDPLARAGGRAASMSAMSRAQITSTNLPMLLHWEDRNSMAFSVEARVPFLDYRVVELAVNLPDAVKIGGGVTKRVLRESMRGTVPDVVLDRRDKMGFVTAEPVWMQEDQSARFRQRLADAGQVLDGVVTPELLARFDQVAAGRANFDHRYLRALTAASWVRQYDVSI